MGRNRARQDAREATNLLSEVVREPRLTWHLLTDRRVSPRVKLIPLTTLLYILSHRLPPRPYSGPGTIRRPSRSDTRGEALHRDVPREIVREHLARMTSVVGSYRVGEEERAPPNLK